MKHGARFASSVCLAISMVFCLALLFYSTTHVALPAHALRETFTGSLSSSPSSGPAGASITISGSGWSYSDGERITFGYMIKSHCSIVPDASMSTFQSGSFSGWLHWPNGTPPGIYQICASVDNTTATAATYTVLSASPPHITISPSKLTAGQLVTLTGSNYFPTGSIVQLFLETTKGRILLTIPHAISNRNGSISRTFRLPTSTFAGDSYKFVASVGGGQIPILSSSISLSYNPQIPIPIPSPTPVPTSDPTPAQHPSPTAIATAVATPIVTQTIGSTAPASSQNTTTGKTPMSGTTGNTSTTNRPTGIKLFAGIGGFLALLTTILFILFMIRRNKTHSMSITEAIGSTRKNQFNWQKNQPGSSVPGSMPYPISNDSTTPTPTLPQQLQISPYVHLLQQPDDRNSSLTNDSTRVAPNDPILESLKRQVQMGLFVTSGLHLDD